MSEAPDGGRGRFTLGRHEVSDTHKDEPAPSTAGAARLIGKARILIAEDNAANRLMIARQTKRLGLAADIVNDGADALSALDERDYDLLITDCAMPGIDGFELTARIRERESGGDRHLPIVALTADATAQQVDACFAAGMDGYLAKPISLHDLGKIARDFLEPSGAEGAPVDKTGAGAPQSSAAAPAPPDDGTTAPPVLDHAALVEIFGELNETTHELLVLFLDTTKPLLVELSRHLANGGDGAARAAAHSAAGAASTAGATELSRICRAVEAALVRGDGAGARDEAGTIDAAFGRLEEAIESLGRQS